MAVYSGFRKPNNKIVVAGEPLVQELKVETATNMYPGRLVKKGTNDDDIVVAGATDTPIGWLGYEHAHPDYRPNTPDTAYSANDRAPVLNGDIIIVGRLASGQNVAKGALLTVAANGELTAATIGTHQVYAIAMESVDASGGAADIMVKSLI
jgi:hypothetical protein